MISTFKTQTMPILLALFITNTVCVVTSAAELMRCVERDGNTTHFYPEGSPRPKGCDNESKAANGYTYSTGGTRSDDDSYYISGPIGTEHGYNEHGYNERSHSEHGYNDREYVEKTYWDVDQFQCRITSDLEYPYINYKNSALSMAKVHHFDSKLKNFYFNIIRDSSQRNIGYYMTSDAMLGSRNLEVFYLSQYPYVSYVAHYNSAVGEYGGLVSDLHVSVDNQRVADLKCRAASHSVLDVDHQKGDGTAYGKTSGHGDKAVTYTVKGTHRESWCESIDMVGTIHFATLPHSTPVSCEYVGRHEVIAN